MHLLEDGKPLILKPGDVCLLDKDRTDNHAYRSDRSGSRLSG